MDGYYEKSDKPFVGLKPDQFNTDQKYAYLDEQTIVNSLIDYSDSSRTHVTLHIPSMHCTSCIWLLEQLHRLNPSILQSSVDFPKRKLMIEYDHNRTTLRQLVELLTSIGYEPRIRLDATKDNKSSRSDRSIYLKIGVAGFAFANIMLFSLPDYFAGNVGLSSHFSALFSWTSLILSLPVLLYSANDYFRSAYIGLKQKQITIDLPLSIGIAVLFSQSLYDITTGTGSGYLDSFSGLVFFLLIGRWFQQKSFQAISFERDYTSYFPIAVLKRSKGKDKSVPVDDLIPGDRIVVRNQEIVPTDAILRNGTAHLNYQFVTGESDLQVRNAGEYLYAGGRQEGSAIELEVARKVSHSYLTQLWNKPPAHTDKHERAIDFADKVARYFTIVVLFLACSAGLYWLTVSPTKATRVVTSILIVACPCALALTAPFAYGMVMRLSAKRGLFLKNSSAVEKLAKTDIILFDKTGTLTDTNSYEIEYHGEKLTAKERSAVKSLASQSTHPVSRYLASQIDEPIGQNVIDFDEVPGQGISGTVDSIKVKIGNKRWVAETDTIDESVDSIRQSQVWVSLNGHVKGAFHLQSKLRNSLARTIKDLKKKYQIALLSGDQPRDEERLQSIFGQESQLSFNKTPFEKLEYVKKLQRENKRILMIGDGLNDAGALKQADVSISISDDTAVFAPASDGILKGSDFDQLPDLLSLAGRSVKVIKIGYALSFLYNLVGLSFAATGNLTPVVSAILMPISSVSVVLFATIATKIASGSKREQL